MCASGRFGGELGVILLGFKVLGFGWFCEELWVCWFWRVGII